MATTKVNTEFIAVNAISGTIIADGAITSTHLAANCVDSSELVTGSIDTIHIAANQVTATKIVTNGVLTRHISDDQVTADKLANSINTDIATGPAALPKAGGTMTGSINLGDNDKVIFGAGSDLEMYHDGSNSYIDEGGTGILYIRSNDVRLMKADGSETMLQADDDGAVNLYHNNAVKLQTESGGLHITGYADADNFKIAGAQGSDGQVLTSTGSGVAWEDASGGVAGISSSADATAITIDSSERIGMPAIGQTHPVGGQAKLGINSTDAAGASLSIHRHYAGVFGGYLVFQKSRNTDITNLGVVSDDDILGSVEFTGADGNSYAQGAHIRALVDGTPGDADMPTRLTFSTSADGSGTPTERMRIDSSGRVGIGTTDPSSGYGGAISAAKVAILSGAAGNNGGSSTLLIGGDDKHYAYMQGTHTSSGNTQLDFGTANGANNPTQRATLNEWGAWKVKSTSGAYFNITSKYHEINSNDGALTTVLIRNGSTYYANCANFWLYGGAPNNTQSQFWTCNDTAGQKASIQSNGGLYNYQSNNSNLCDEREKKNIEVLPNTWNSVKSWKLKKFHYNEDEDSDDKRLGVIAQEIETTNPELITAHTRVQAKDAVLWTEEDDLPEGVSVGDTRTAAQDAVVRKGVKEQQMYIMAIKALQEAMTEIESLKARIETLEG